MEWTPKINNKEPVPTFLEVWETGETGEMSDTVRNFMATTYSKIIARELMTSLEEMVEKGETTEAQLLEEAIGIMESDNEGAKRDYIANLISKHSLTANALMVANNGVPDDISELLSE